MPIKGGAKQETIFDTIHLLKEKGLTLDEAIEEVQSILRGKLPEHILEMIRRDY